MFKPLLVASSILTIIFIKQRINLGHALSEGTSASDLIVEMADNVYEETEGRIKIDVFPNSQLVSETEMLEQVRTGSTEAAAIMVGSMKAQDMRMAIEDLPYVERR